MHLGLVALKWCFSYTFSFLNSADDSCQILFVIQKKKAWYTTILLKKSLPLSEQNVPHPSWYKKRKDSFSWKAIETEASSGGVTFEIAVIVSWAFWG